MFQVGDQILCVLRLILRVSPKPIPDIFYKVPNIVAIFTKKGLEFSSGYNNIRLFFLSMPAFKLYPASANAIPKKKSRKRSVILSIRSSYIEMVFALLAKPNNLDATFQNTSRETEPWEIVPLALLILGAPEPRLKPGPDF